MGEGRLFGVRRIISCGMVLVMLFCAAYAESDVPLYTPDVNYATLLRDMVDAYEQGGNTDRMDRDVEALQDDMAAFIAAHWKKVYLDPDYQLLLLGKDDPSQLPIMGKHAFVVLGYELLNGEMTDELKGRCDAAAEAARAFPDSILVCSGGATGSHNPERHTEAGLMKDYLEKICGISEKRIFIDERAKTTVENAVNTFAILREQEIESITIVTSSYHQRWGQVLYNAMAVRSMKQDGYYAEIIGNFCFDVLPSDELFLQDDRIAVRQLGEILGLPRYQMDMLPRLVY